MKKILTLLALVSCIAIGSTTSRADTAPKSVIHVVTVAWKEGTTPEQIKAALDGAQALPSKYAGITRVWTKVVKNQWKIDDKTKVDNIIVMEFADEAALKAYTDSDAQKEWYKLYLPIRGSSRTSDITN